MSSKYFFIFDFWREKKKKNKFRTLKLVVLRIRIQTLDFWKKKNGFLNDLDIFDLQAFYSDFQKLKSIWILHLQCSETCIFSILGLNIAKLENFQELHDCSFFRIFDYLGSFKNSMLRNFLDPIFIFSIQTKHFHIVC